MTAALARAQQIRFCASFDGARIAYAESGEGLPLVKAPHWLTHLEYEWTSPVWQPWLQGLTAGRRLVRLDQRGNGLSDRDVGEISLEAWLRDLEAVVDRAGLDRFALLGHSQGASIAIEYARRHPERVSHLVMLGGYARGRIARGVTQQGMEEIEAQLKLVELGWGRDDPVYRQMFSVQFAPDADAGLLQAFGELQRISSEPATAVRIMRALFQVDVAESARKVQAPTLVLHARGDRRAPFEEGRLIASLIPGARFVPLETRNHVLLAGEPAFSQFFDELNAFLPGGLAGRPAAFAGLTAREAQVLERIGQGLDNAQIAAHLGMSEKTVRNHVTRIFDKLGVENRSQAMLRALGRG